MVMGNDGRDGLTINSHLQGYLSYTFLCTDAMSICYRLVYSWKVQLICRDGIVTPTADCPLDPNHPLKGPTTSNTYC